MNRENAVAADALLQRRQFILGPSFLESRPSWKRIQVRNWIHITAHPDLGVHQVSRQGMSLTLLGYMLDPAHPESSDVSILEALLEYLVESGTFGDWVKHTYPIGGRWIIVVDDGNDVRLFTDPMGLRQVFYTDPELTTECWCATQAGLIAEHLRFETDPVAEVEYIRSKAFQAWPEYIWPADSSPYTEIRHLLPNHALHLITRVVTRFWPDGPIGSLSLNESASISANLLKRIIEAAAARFDLALGISAGYDSRLLLAASRSVAERMRYYTYVGATETADAVIAPRLLSSLGLHGTLALVPSRMNKDLEETYNRSYSLAHAYTGRYLQALVDSFPHGCLNVTGNAAEITRVRFRLQEPDSIVTPKDLARFTSFQFADEMERIPFVLRSWERWLAGLGNTYDMHILDLFYWEHWGGNFAAMDQAETDIAVDTLTPYNCRLLLQHMLAAPEAFRDHDRPRLYEEMIGLLWPETLRVPVNPTLPRGIAKTLGDARWHAWRATTLKLRSLLRRLGL